MVRERDAQEKLSKAHRVFLRLVLSPYTVHFKSLSYIKDTTLDLLDRKVCKETLKGTAQQAALREAIGTDAKVWDELCSLLRAAVPSVERRCFTIWDHISVDYESTSGALIASHYPGLWKDLERLNDLVSIARNVLTVGDRAQDLAAICNVDLEMFCVINCCIRVAARGYDGDVGTGDEDKWQLIVNAYKKLLITSLQFLNNFVAQNEKRKMMLWLYLFDTTIEPEIAPEDVPETSSASLTDIPSNPNSKPTPPLNSHDLLLAFGTNGTETLETAGAQPLWDSIPFSDHPLPKEAIKGREILQGNGYAFYVKRATKICIDDYKMERKREPTTAEIHLDIPRRWAELSYHDRHYWQCLYEDSLVKYRQDRAVYEAKVAVVREKYSFVRRDIAKDLVNTHLEIRRFMLVDLIRQDNATGTRSAAPEVMRPDSHDSYLTKDNENLQSRPSPADDMRMLFTAAAGTKILKSGKLELMKRLEGFGLPWPAERDIPSSRHSDRTTGRTQSETAESRNERSRSLSHSPSSLVRIRSGVLISNTDLNPEEGPGFEEGSGEDEDEDEDEDSEGDLEDDKEEDYPGSTEDGRGLLTDVPLILGPSEIEVLPMLIMSCIVPPTDLLPQLSEKAKNATTNMHTVRTHLLLSQSNGRNLLRELLIFVAAWDLREEELYFKFMVKIMEAILQNGLMPYAYHSFRDRSRSKDIISPAQAVIMKLLTCIFRARGEASKAAQAANVSGKSPAMDVAIIIPSRRPLYPGAPTQVDLHILNFIFTEFRQHIIPQTCALIFLQGQIHAGRASPEDFPLNLWDMERMYEGVYQYLEFFAVLTEESIWKGILGDWEMASELVTLLRELETGIPKRSVATSQTTKGTESQPLAQAILGDSNASAQASTPVAVERPFDVDASNTDPALPPLPSQPSSQRISEGDTPLAYPEDPVMPLGHDLQHDQDEPSDFEWRNLKKLTVLVLSSLLWKNSLVQHQVRKYGGLAALVCCCKADEHNPYIREHAIMCLRFAVEGCEENARAIRQMAAPKGQSSQSGGSHAEDVPREVLDAHGYETFMDPKGQVGLRRKDTAQTTGPASASGAAASSSSSHAGISAATTRLKSSNTRITAEKAAEHLQNALRELPLGDKLVTDKQKAEALAKIELAFETTERVLGRSKKG